MLVTGVQSVGSKGVNTVQVAAVDTTEVAKFGETGSESRGRRLSLKPGVPVVATWKAAATRVAPL